MKILAVFEGSHKREGELIGRILAGYSELEIALMVTVIAVREEFDSVFKAMFRTRGETQRIDIADALGRHHYHRIEHGTVFEMAIGGMRWCLKIRNQYAHCAWNIERSSQRLGFSNLEDLSTKHTRTANIDTLPRYYIDIPLLEAQMAYFEYVNALLWWLADEARAANGSKKLGFVPIRPKHLEQPDEYIA